MPITRNTRQMPAHPRRSRVSRGDTLSQDDARHRSRPPRLQASRSRVRRARPPSTVCRADRCGRGRRAGDTHGRRTAKLAEIHRRKPCVVYKTTAIAVADARRHHNSGRRGLKISAVPRVKGAGHGKHANQDGAGAWMGQQRSRHDDRQKDNRTPSVRSTGSATTSAVGPR